jgi:predicted nicotinamide N-methyase
MIGAGANAFDSRPSVFRPSVASSLFSKTILFSTISSQLISHHLNHFKIYHRPSAISHRTSTCAKMMFLLLLEVAIVVTILPSSIFSSSFGVHSFPTTHHVNVRTHNPRTSRNQYATTTLNGRRSGKRRGGGGGASSNNKENEIRNDQSAQEIPAPTKYKLSLLRIQSDDAHTTTCSTSTTSDNSRPAHTDIAMCEIDDADWWEAKTLLEDNADSPRKASDNPFGARAWPSSLAVAQHLVGLSASSSSSSSSSSSMKQQLDGRNIMEIGCGTGLASIAAASLGANVLATDVSPLVLELTRRGWAETKKRRAAAAEKGNASGTGNGTGTLSTAVFDVTSNTPLPIPKHDASVHGELQPIVIATAVLYESELADFMAARVAEAVGLGAYVVVADGDEGQREGGRQRFEIALDERLDELDGGHTRSTWIPVVAKCPELGWRQKNVRLMHLNGPPDAI